jgi:hypothetical protein
MEHPALIIVPIIFLIVGAAMVIWPDTVRKYDQRMTKLIKTREEYVLVTRLMGGSFIFAGGFFLFLMLMGLLK